MRDQNQERVSAKIAPHVYDFCADNSTFHMSDLVKAVQDALGDEFVAPDSPSRILRSLRAQGLVHYKVLNRRESLYQVNNVR